MAIYDDPSEQRYRKSKKGRANISRANKNNEKSYKRISIAFQEEDWDVYFLLKAKKSEDASVNEICIAAIRTWLVLNAR